MNKIRKNKVTRLHPVICTLSLFACIATAAVATIVVNQTSTEVKDRVIANSDDIPKSWSTTNQLSAVAQLDEEVLANNYVEYTSHITNQGASGVYITHLSSYLSNSDSAGFIPLGDNNIEYTYQPADASSWRELAITAPANDSGAFTLASELYLDPSATVHLRYYVSPDASVTTMSNKLAVLLTDHHGLTGYTEDVAVLDYASTVAKMTAAAEAIAASDTEETYAEPLGVFSFTPSIAATTSTVAQTGSINTSFIKTGLKLSVAIFLAVLFCLVIFLTFRHPRHQKTH